MKWEVIGMGEDYQIPQHIAQKTVDLLYEAIGCNINVMGAGGKIIATKQPERLGCVHEGGRRVIAGEEDVVSVTKEMAETMQGVLPGYMGPVLYKDQRIGCIGITGNPNEVMPLQKLAVMVLSEEIAKFYENRGKEELLQTLVVNVENASASIQEVSAGAQEIAATSQSLEDMASKIETSVREVKRVLDLVGNIVNQTNLLGLNAAIEAARAGEHGRGFSIVAEEVRKLAANSQESLQGTAKVLKEIQMATDEISQGVKKTALTTSEQANALQIISQNVVEVGSNMNCLAGLTKIK